MRNWVNVYVATMQAKGASAEDIAEPIFWSELCDRFGEWTALTLDADQIFGGWLNSYG